MTYILKETNCDDRDGTILGKWDHKPSRIELDSALSSMHNGNVPSDIIDDLESYGNHEISRMDEIYYELGGV